MIQINNKIVLQNLLKMCEQIKNAKEVVVVDY